MNYQSIAKISLNNAVQIPNRGWIVEFKLLCLSQTDPSAPIKEFVKAFDGQTSYIYFIDGEEVSPVDYNNMSFELGN